MEKYLEEAKDEAKKTERIQAIRNMIELEVPKEKILKKYSLEEYQEAEASLTTILWVDVYNLRDACQQAGVFFVWGIIKCIH